LSIILTQMIDKKAKGRLSGRKEWAEGIFGTPGAGSPSASGFVD